MNGKLHEVVGAVEKIRSTSKLNEKTAILEDMDEETWEDFCVYADWTLNPYVTFGIDPTKVALDDCEGHALSDVETVELAFEVLATKLSTRELTGHAARAAVNNFLSALAYPAWLNFFTCVLDKDFKAGMQAKTVNKVAPGLIPEFSAMLCDKYRGGELAVVPSWAEEKLDGMRVLSVFEEDACRAVSRNGHPVQNMNLLIEELSPFLEGHVLDGELYGKTWEESISAGRKAGAKVDAIYKVFDILPYEEFLQGRSSRVLTERRKELTSRINAIHTALPHLKKRLLITKRKKVETPEEVYAFAEKLMARGEEGIVLKDPNSFYETKRSKSWLKVTRELMPGSEQHDVDYEIIGTQEGKGRWVGMLGAFRCVNEQGQEFTCSGKMSLAMRKKFWKERNDLVGYYVETRFREFYPSGIPKFPIFQRLRVDK
jgi:DNA ligase 1